jgi:hypothetical protein
MNTAPVNHQKQRATPEALASAASYAIQVADHYVRWLGDERGHPGVQGLRMLEVGPGPTLGTPVLLACFGARVAAADRFLPQWDPDFHPAFFAELLRQLTPRGAGCTRPLSRVLAENAFAAAVECHPLAAEELGEIGDAFDVVYSNAVLEHVQDLAVSAASLAAITVPDGFNFHQVDLRDHRNFDRPLEYLTMPRREFEALRRECHCECGALWRASDVAAAFDQVGFSVSVRPNLSAAPDYIATLRPRLSPEFAQRSDEDLTTISAFFAMRRRRTD